MHTQGPLKRDDRALHGLQKQERENERDRRPDQHLHPDRRIAEGLEGEHRAHDHMAYDQDHEIGGQIIGTVQVERFAAMSAGVDDLEVPGEQSTNPAMRAAPREAARDRGLDVANRCVAGGLIGEARHRGKMRCSAMVRKRGEPCETPCRTRDRGILRRSETSGEWRLVSFSSPSSLKLAMWRSSRNGPERLIVNKILPTAFLCLAFSPVQLARAGDAAPQNSLFLPSGKSEAMQALEAKKNARCLALYGPGFGALGDTDTCIRIGGRVGVSVGVSTKQNRLIMPSQGIGAPAPTLGGPAVAVVRQPKTGSATNADVYVETRTQTEMGEISTHVGVGAVRATGALAGPDYVH
jgi:hypothetical protein